MNDKSLLSIRDIEMRASHSCGSHTSFYVDII
jgi:hypothetical protein